MRAAFASALVVCAILSVEAGDVVVNFDASGGEMGADRLRVVRSGGTFGESVNIFPSGSSGNFSSLDGNLSDYVFAMTNINKSSSAAFRNYFSKPLASKYIVEGVEYQYVFEALAVSGTAWVVTGQNYSQSSQLSGDSFVVTNACTNVISKVGLASSADFLERAFTYAQAKTSYALSFRVSLFAGGTLGEDGFRYVAPGSAINVGALPCPKRSKIGCRFNGWKDAAGNVIGPESVVPSGKSSVTLTADWVDLGYGAEVTIEGADRPYTGMKLTAKANLDGCRFEWIRGSVNGVYDDAVVAEGSEYTLSDSDLEHWIRVLAYVDDVYVATAKIYFSKLPVMYLDTDGGAAIADKVNYIPSTLRLQGNALFAEQYNGAAEVKGRGNSSWTYNQKPYKLKLGSKANIFGFGKNKHWVLISNYGDNALIRNELASEVAKAIGVLAMDIEPVVLVLNGSYNGVYALSEHIRIDENRVDIFDWESKAEDIADALYDANRKTAGWTKDDKSALEEQMSSNFSWITASNIVYKGTKYRLVDYGLCEDWNLSGGFLYEMDDYWDEVSKFKTDVNAIKVNVSKPEYAATDVSLMNSAKKIWNDYEAALLAVDKRNPKSGLHYSELSDLDSSVGYWLVMETMGNLDAVWKSRYSYVDAGGKLTFGPVWDFDWSCDSVYIHDYASAAPTVWSCCKSSRPESVFREWLSDPCFCVRAYEMYWSRLRPWLAAAVVSGGVVDAKRQYLKEAAASHDTKFKRCGFDTDIARCKSFLTARLAWFDKQFESVDMLMSSARNASCASPYDKREDILKFSLSGGFETNIVCRQDFRLSSEVDAVISVSVKTDTVSRIVFYVNGINCGAVVVADSTCEIIIPRELFAAKEHQRDVVQIIAYDSESKVVGRSYMTIRRDADAPLYGMSKCIEISEVMASNGGIATNDFERRCLDWIEIHNKTNVAVDISGWRMIDKITKKWKNWEALPSGVIVPAGGYMLVWGDNEPGYTGWTNGEVHVNIGLSSSGEAIALAHGEFGSEEKLSESQIESWFEFPALIKEVAYGRNSTNGLQKFIFPTPAAANDERFGVVSDISEVAEVFADDPNVVANVTNEEALVDFNIYLCNRRVRKIGDLTQKQREHIYGSYLVASLVREEVFLEDEPVLNIAEFQKHGADDEKWSVTIALTEGDDGKREVALAKKAVRKRVKKSSDIHEWQAIPDSEIHSVEEDGNRVKLVISPKHESGRQYIKVGD